MTEYGQARVLNEAELIGLRTIAGETRHGLRNVCIVDFSFNCGLRAKEISGLKLSDVVGNDGKIKEVVRLDKTIVKNGIKKNKGRDIYLTNKGVRKRLQAYLDVRGTDEGLLFRTQKSGFTSQSIQHLFRKLYEDAGLEGCSSHSGRRTFATNLDSNGVSISYIKELMGHESIQMTDRYIANNPNKLKEMASALP